MPLTSGILYFHKKMKGVVSMKKVILYISFVFIAFLGIALMGCTDKMGDTDNIRGVPDNNSRRFDLAMMRTMENHQVNIDDLSKIVLNAFNNKAAADTRKSRAIIDASNIVSTRSVSINTRNGFKRSEKFSRDEHGNRRRSSDVYGIENVEMYEFIIDDGSGTEWFVVACNDIRVGHVLSITQGSFESSDSELATFLRESLHEYIEAVIQEYNNITDDEAEVVLNTEIARNTRGSTPVLPGNPEDWRLIGHSSNLQIQRGPLLMTQWGQGSDGYTATGFAYNNYIKHHFRNRQDGHLYVTGCGVTAFAQIIAYHNFIKHTLNLNNLGAAVSAAMIAPAFTDATSSTMNMGTWNRHYNLSIIRTMPHIRNNASAEAKGQVAALMFHVFQELGATPKPGSTTTNRGAYVQGFRNWGYIIAEQGAATTLSGTSSNFSIQYHTGLSTIRSAINNNRPILARGGTTTGSGHAWVIDGHGSITWIEEYYEHIINKQIFTRSIALNNVLMVHCNMGWDGYNSGYNGWYIYGIFDTAANGNHSQQNIKKGNGNFSTDTWLVIPRRP